MGVFSKAKVINKVVLIPIDQIVPNPAQPRKNFDTAQLAALAQSIQANGLLQPISVRKLDNRMGDTYEIIAGERRYLACKNLGMREIAAIVETVSDDRSAVLALIENIQRSNLNYFEEAAAIQALINRWNITQEQAAKRLGKSQSAVANKLRLLKFNVYSQEKMLENGLTERHARALLKLEDSPLLESAIDFIGKNQLTVAATEKYVEGLLEGKGKKPGGKRIMVVKDLKIFLNTINRAMDTMKEAGIAATTETNEDENYIEYIVKIPKQAAYRSKAKV